MKSRPMMMYAATIFERDLWLMFLLCPRVGTGS
jgi:hypothetical protein